MDKETQKQIFKLGVAIKNLVLIDEVIERHEQKLLAMTISRDKLRAKIGATLFSCAEFRALELQGKEPYDEPEVFFELDHYFITGKTDENLEIVGVEFEEEELP